VFFRSQKSDKIMLQCQAININLDLWNLEQNLILDLMEIDLWDQQQGDNIFYQQQKCFFLRFICDNFLEVKKWNIFKAICLIKFEQFRLMWFQTTKKCFRIIAEKEYFLSWSHISLNFLKNEVFYHSFTELLLCFSFAFFLFMDILFTWGHENVTKWRPHIITWDTNRTRNARP